MNPPIYTLQGPVSALELGGGWTTTLCPLCGRGFTQQTGALSVELMGVRSIYVSSSNILMVADEALQSLKDKIGPSVTWEPVLTRWRSGLGAGMAPPVVHQVTPNHCVYASSASITRSRCRCNAITRISMERLIVQPASHPTQGEDIAYLHENPRVTVVADRVRVALLTQDSTLEFARAFYENEDIPPIGSTFEGISWSDL